MHDTRLIHAVTAGAGGSVHLFPGQGDFAVSALVRAVRSGGPVRDAVREVFASVDQVASERGLPALGPWLLGPSPVNGRDLAAAPTGTSQLALFATSVAVHRALCTTRGAPGAVLGVSFGEIAALTCADVLTLEDGARLAHDLARILSTCPGGLTLLACGETDALALIGRSGVAAVAVACVNDDQETVLSGPLADLSDVEKLAADHGVAAVRLRLPFSSHHPSLTDQARRFAAAIRRYPVGRPRCAVFSAVAGRAYVVGDDMARCLADCLIRPARLPAVLPAVADTCPGALLEAGTGSALAHSSRRVLADRAPAVHAPLADADFTWRPAATPAGGVESRPRRSREAAALSPVSAAGLIDAGCDPSFLDALRDALTPRPAADHQPGPVNRSRHLVHGLRRLTLGLPTARLLLSAPDRMAALHAWTAVADPALCMTAVNHYLLCLGSMAQLAPDHAALESHFDALESGRARGTYLITEVGQANSHLATGTRAEFDARTREFVLDTPEPAAAKFSSVGGMGSPQIGVALARLVVRDRDCGVFPFVVDLTDSDGPLPGVEISSVIEVGALPLDYAQIRFRRLRLPFAHWLRDSAGISADGTFHDPLGSADARLQRTLCVGRTLWGVLPTAAAAVSCEASVLALRYARQRRTQGRLAPGTPLIDYRTQQHAVLGALADSYALTCAAGQARALWAQALAAHSPTADGDGGGGGDAMTFSPWAAVSRPLAAYKAHTARAAARITAECQRRCGLAGHLDVNRLAAYHGFFHAFDPAGGDSQLIFYDLGRALADEPAPLHAPMPADLDAESPDWWPAVLRTHQRRLTRALQRSRAESGPPGTGGFTAWNPLLEHAGELGEVYAARLEAEDTVRALTHLQDPRLTAVLPTLAALHGTLSARRWAGSLLAAGTLRPRHLQHLTQVADHLCDRLLPQLTLLEDVFAHPQQIVLAPLGEPDYNQALADTLSWTPGGTP